VTRVSLTVGSIVAAVLTVGLPTHADGPDHGKDWPMIGRDIANTRHQPDERRIGVRNVERLRTKWAVTTGGDVSATPAVIVDAEHHHRHHPHHKHHPHHAHAAVYFPDWGPTPPPQPAPAPDHRGRLWKVDAETGEVIWSRYIFDYNRIPGALSRTSPAYARGMIFIGDLNGNMMGIDAATGDLLWITELDPNPNTIVTTSPVVHGNRLYIATSSSGGGVARQIFRGSMVALDIHTGKIIWQTFVLPDNGGVPGGFAGGAFVNPPAIDVESGLIYAAAGQLYAWPDAVDPCFETPEGWDEEACFPPGAYFNSVIAFDLRTGRPRWSFRGAGPDARKLGCGDPAPSWCPPWENNFSVWDFAGSGANVFRARIGGRWRNVVGIGEKSGVYWALDARNGRFLWATLVGHGDDPGGIQWGTTVDDRRIYAAIGHLQSPTRTPVPYTLPSGETITGGSWAALDPSSGRILWQTPDPQGAADLAALTVANGVLYAGSMAHIGDQMYALDTRTGDILWRFPAGGSVVSGPAVVDGTVYWGSGYARTGGVGNDRFYAFSVARR
jgi:polyvinyl alcohol dehydrogenase (cytochrome)